MHTPPANPDVADEAPTSGQLTAYDEEHVVTYLRLLDANAEGADPSRATPRIWGPHHAALANRGARPAPLASLALASHHVGIHTCRFAPRATASVIASGRDGGQPLGNSMKIPVQVDVLVDDDGKLLLVLPGITTIMGNLDLRNRKIRSLPDNLSVRGFLDLEGTPITSLPKNLKIGGYLNLIGTGITSLPDNMSVGGDLDLSDMAITSLPDNLSVGGDLYLIGTKVSVVPATARICGKVFGLL